MELQELKALWQEHHNQTVHRLKLNTVLLKKLSFDGIKSKLRVVKATAIFELIINGVFLVFLMSFMADHWQQWSFFVPALILWMMVQTHFIFNIYVLVQLGSLHYDMNIIDLQRRIHRIELYQRYQIRSLYIVIPVFLACFAVVMAKALLGMDLYLILGQIGIPQVYWVYQILGTFIISAIIVWFLEKFPDEGLTGAREFLNEIATFEQME